MCNFIQKYNAKLFTLLLSSGQRKRLVRCPGNKVNSCTFCAVKRMYGKPATPLCRLLVIYKHNKSVKFGEKLASLCFELSGTAYKHHK